jgi:hypothetical protein
MSNDPLGALIQQSPILASIAAAILLLCCASLVAFWRLRRRLAAMQTRLDGFSEGLRMVEVAQEGLRIRLLNLPRSREAPESSSPSSATLEEKMTSSGPKQGSADRGQRLWDEQQIMCGFES